jgi:hypothetical protein
MSNKPSFELHALRDALSRLDTQQERIKKYLNVYPEKSKKKGFFHRLFGWFS